MSTTIIQDRIKELRGLIGNTPLLEIKFKYKGEERRIFAKAEHYNLTGSIKDRMAIHVLSQAYLNGEIQPGDLIAEATSGNTGISFAAIGSALGHKVTIFMPQWMSAERKNLIRSYGANIQLVSHEQGGFLGSIKMTEDFAKENRNVFLPCQFSNEYNVEAHYRTTGPEIWHQLEQINLKPDAVVAGVGTGGTIMGLGKYFREKDPNIKVYPLEPSNSPTLKTGSKIGIHRIQGISDEFIPPIVKLDQLDPIIDVDDGDAIIIAQKLSATLGLGVGISSGANFLGALLAQETLGKDAIVVTIFSDDNKKYLSTDLMKSEPIKEDFLSTEIELLDLKCHLARP
ncbi:PLP-dependent cysteine synthase family protein [Alkaliphilus oremlandii]|uniref:cysteine synthase n=1 Tax=Alkaliphilus oremlandii (strain OhILAs) TaxID=350688 RepID=A8MEP6_ALKOO|nr:PLP-dependent cysteine synthase family protein [Alkaliphilus oremlandii]ABW18375.1 Pyridoxal-5'-phosphate-dependent protein beta subunit [Alkaliphilus oremlandii OhILAs]